MKLTIDRNLLIRAINLVIKATDKRHRFAILANIKLDLSQDQLVLTGSDLEMQLTTCVPLKSGECLQPGSTTLPAEMFFNVCKSLSDEKVVIDAPETGRCLITSGKGKYTLNTLFSTDFPSIGTPNPSTLVQIAQDELASLISHTRFAMALQDVRHYLTGMLFEIDENQLTAVATDGHRLAVAHRQLPGTYPQTRVIIPGKAVAELERLLAELAKDAKPDQGMVTLGFDGEFLQLGLTLNEGDHNLQVGLTARLIEGKFPDYRRVLPKNNDKVAHFEKEELMDVLRRISVLNNKDYPGVVFQFAQADSVKVEVSNRESEAEENLAVIYQGEEVEISFNEAYLRAVLNVLDGKICLEMNQPGTPALIYQLGDSQHQYVVMPMRI